ILGHFSAPSRLALESDRHDLGEHDQRNNEDELHDDERRNAPEDFLQLQSGHGAMNNEDVDADRRSHCAYLDQLGHEDPENHRMNAHGFNDGKNNWHRNENHRNAIDQTTQQNIGNDKQQQQHDR